MEQIRIEILNELKYIHSPRVLKLILSTVKSYKKKLENQNK